jgi:hypothetical protein
MIDPDVRGRNQAIIDQLRNPSMNKEAAEGVSDYLRIRAREDGYARRIQPPIPVTPADLDRQVDTTKPVIVRDMEPNSAGAYSVPFGATPMNTYMDAPRYRIMFERIESFRYIADVANLLTYDLDIRQIFNDLMLKDILGEEDRKYTVTADFIVGGLNDLDPVTNPRIAEVGSAGFITVGVMSRSALAYAMEGLPSSNRHLNPAVALLNNITIWRVVAVLTRNEAGGDLSQDLLLNGFTEREMLGLKWAITIKTNLVATADIYYFAAPKFLGDFYTMEDVTVSVKHENYMFEMFAYEMLGATIKNTGAVCKARFSGTQEPWTP